MNHSIKICLFLTLVSLKFAHTQPAFPVPIKTAVYIVDVREIDGARQSFSADVLIRLRWKDETLASQQKVRSVPINTAWHPNVQIVNRISLQTTFPEILEVDSNGNVIYRQRFIGQFSCAMNLTEFPFDQQEFPIRLVAVGYSPSIIQFVKDSEDGRNSKFSQTDWKVLSWKENIETYTVPGGRQLAGYKFAFVAERYFRFFLVQIILPITLILGMSWIAFWLDRTQPGPRISISITSMLTIIAYRLLLANFIPRLPYLTRMDYFVFVSTILVFLSLVNVVFISRLVGKKDSTATKIDTNSRWIFPLLFLFVVIACFFI